MASTQVSIDEFLDAYEEPDESADESDDDSEIVFASKGGDRYHAERCGIPACPDINGEQITLQIAAKRQLRPCGRCNPTDYRDEKQQPDNATLEGF